MIKNIFFIKPAKCGTESIKYLLLKYSQKHNLVVNDNAFNNFYNIKKFNVSTNHIPHTNYSYDFFKNAINNLDHITITSIRNPLNRLISHYYYDHPNTKIDFNRWYIDSINKGIKSWGNPIYQNFLTNYISNFMGISDYSQFNEKYDFVFVVENMEESFVKFNSMIEFNCDNIKLNVNCNHIYNKFTPSEEVVETFNSLNQQDISLYNHIISSV